MLLKTPFLAAFFVAVTTTGFAAEKEACNDATGQRALKTGISQQASATRYHRVAIDDVEVFYREAGSRNKPTVVLLHGFPTSSHMFRNLIPKLADRYHVIAPDYQGTETARCHRLMNLNTRSTT